MDFRTYSDEELRTFLRAGCTSFDNKKLAEREALNRFIRYHGPTNEEMADESYDEGFKAGKEEGYSRGYDAGEADALENAG